MLTKQAAFHRDTPGVLSKIGMPNFMKRRHGADSRKRTRRLCYALRACRGRRLQI